MVGAPLRILLCIIVDIIQEDSTESCVSLKVKVTLRNYEKLLIRIWIGCSWRML